jgi:hypothetical protein
VVNKVEKNKVTGYVSTPKYGTADAVTKPEGGK